MGTYLDYLYLSFLVITAAANINITGSWDKKVYTRIYV